MKNKIPKVIHYCWFGKKEKPPIVKACIDSWKNNLPDYQLVEWNEENFDINCNLYVREAYKLGKYAFVSDYARVKALYQFGGVYLDTDVKVFKSFNDLLQHESFWGFEQGNYIATSTIGAAEGNDIIKVFLDTYENLSFKNNDGTLNQLTNVAMITKILEEQGLIRNGDYQMIKGNAFYPQTYFSPYDYINCRKFISDQTYCIHHFHKSWLPASERFKGILKRFVAKIIGGNNLAIIRKLVSGS